MNFGPINQRGGEKRLNVIFSRARQHMAVVSSIRHDAITNDYNEGAAALKQFLRYAEHMSRGHLEAAQQVLAGLNPMTRKALSGDGSADQVTEHLARALRQRGHVVDTQIGQSRFRCDLGVRDPQHGHYVVGVLIDTAAHYSNRDVFERYVSRPGILVTFGWRTLQVLSRDWHHEPQAVLDRIERAMREPIAIPERADEVSFELPVEARVAPPATVASTTLEVESAVHAPAAPFAGSSSLRRFEYIDGNSCKFWQISRKTSEVTVTFGRIGTQGQTQIKQFANEQRAEQEVNKLVAEKLKRGYVEATAGTGPGVSR
jgi:predicted DNA-binding WGR domain protein